jgi:GNAT superfamily N-acetyltransferase
MQTTVPVIKRAVASDEAVLAELGRSTFYDTFTGTCTEKDMEEVLETFYNLKQVAEELQDPEDYYYIAWINDLPVGYVRIKFHRPFPIPLLETKNAIELKRLYVVKSYIGKGIGKLLMDFTEDFARTKNYEYLYLSVWEFNERAKKFYQNCGFIDSLIPNDFPLGSTPQTDYWYYKSL